MHHPRQYLGHLRRVGVFEINHPHVAALLERGIQIGDQFTNPIDAQFVGGDHHAIGPFVGNENDFLGRVSAIPLLGFLESTQHLDHIFGNTIAKLDDLGGLHGRAVHALNDFDNAVDVGADI